jgi:hypothetical protein
LIAASSAALCYSVSWSGIMVQEIREADEMADLVFRKLCVVHILF